MIALTIARWRILHGVPGLALVGRLPQEPESCRRAAVPLLPPGHGHPIQISTAMSISPQAAPGRVTRAPRQCT